MAVSAARLPLLATWCGSMIGYARGGGGRVDGGRDQDLCGEGGERQGGSAGGLAVVRGYARMTPTIRWCGRMCRAGGPGAD